MDKTFRDSGDAVRRVKPRKVLDRLKKNLQTRCADAALMAESLGFAFAQGAPELRFHIARKRSLDERALIRFQGIENGGLIGIAAQNK